MNVMCTESGCIKALLMFQHKYMSIQEFLTTNHAKLSPITKEQTSKLAKKVQYDWCLMCNIVDNFQSYLVYF